MTIDQKPNKKGKWSSLNKGGRPPKYEDESILNISINSYFSSCAKIKNKIIMPNKAGLCVYLGISRDTYSEYRKRFPDTIKRADDIIENLWIQRLASNAPTGAIFYLKNAFKESFKDKQEIDHQSGSSVITGITYIIPKDPDNKNDIETLPLN